MMFKCICYLAIDAGTTDPRGDGVAAHSARDAISRPRVAPEDGEGNTRAEARQHREEAAGLPEAVGILAYQAGWAEASHEAF